MVWPIAAAMTAAVVAFLLLTLRRAAPGAASRSAYDLAVYRDQLAEVARDLARGVLTAEQAESARLEIQRRMLRADEAMAVEANSAESEPKPRTSGVVRWTVKLIVALGLPTLALAVYAIEGSPDIPGRPFSGRTADAGGADIEGMVRGLAGRLATQSPDDLNGWVMLGRSYMVLERYPLAVDAFGHAMTLGQRRPDIASQYGEALVMAANGVVTPEAKTVFAEVAGKDSGDLRARYYLGLAHSQAGQPQAAVDAWTRILAEAPAEEPGLDQLRDELRALAATNNITLDEKKIVGKRATPSAASSTPADGVRGPSEADMAAMAKLSPEERQQFIRDRVASLEAKLAESPNDSQGWIMLARSYGVLGEAAKAREILARGAKALPGDAGVQLAYARDLIGPHPDRPAPPDALAALGRVLASDPNNDEALWHLGLAEEAAGNKKAARQYWERLLQQLEPGSEGFTSLGKRIESLGK